MTEQQGIFDKYTVERNDQQDGRCGKHHKCEYFILDLTHDLHALAALKAYAKSCEDEKPRLAEDLRAKVAELHARQRSASDYHRAFNKLADAVEAKSKLGEHNDAESLTRLVLSHVTKAIVDTDKFKDTP